MDYEKYIKLNILYPIGIYDMHIARSFYYQRFPSEVTYYDKPNSKKVVSYDGSGEWVPRPYGGNDMQTIAATGGWLASPSEFMKFMLAIDGFDSRPDILSKKSINLMVKPSEFGPYGWKGTTNGFWWRTGTLSGTSALIARQSNEICWIALFNTSTAKSTRFHRYIHRAMNEVLSSVSKWPDYDLFEYDTNKKNSLFAIN